jgi:hypothetical protein
VSRRSIHRFTKFPNGSAINFHLTHFFDEVVMDADAKVRERAREREGQGERQGARERERARERAGERESQGEGQGERESQGASGRETVCRVTRRCLWGCCFCCLLYLPRMHIPLTHTRPPAPPLPSTCAFIPLTHAHARPFAPPLLLRPCGDAAS